MDGKTVIFEIENACKLVNPYPALGIYGFASDKARLLFTKLAPYEEPDIDVWTRDILKSDFYIKKEGFIYLGAWKND